MMFKKKHFRACVVRYTDTRRRKVEKKTQKKKRTDIKRKKKQQQQQKSDRGDVPGGFASQTKDAVLHRQAVYQDDSRNELKNKHRPWSHQKKKGVKRKKTGAEAVCDNDGRHSDLKEDQDKKKDTED